MEIRSREIKKIPNVDIVVKMLLIKCFQFEISKKPNTLIKKLISDIANVKINGLMLNVFKKKL